MLRSENLVFKGQFEPQGGFTIPVVRLGISPGGRGWWLIGWTGGFLTETTENIRDRTKYGPFKVPYIIPLLESLWTWKF